MRELLRALGEQCSRENAGLSALPPRGEAYQKILDWGMMAVPFILERMSIQSEWHWICALSQITGEHPFPESSAGRFDEITLSWLEWGARKEFLPLKASPISLKTTRMLLKAKLRMFGTEVILNMCNRGFMASDWNARLLKEPRAIISTAPMDAIDLNPLIDEILNLLGIEGDDNGEDPE